MSFKDEIIIYQSEDGITKIEVTMNDDTVWLSKGQMAELFKRDRSVISKHIKNIFTENEVDEKSNVHFLHIANSDKPVAFYSLDVIISVGYRVKSLSGTQFRIWANERLREYLIKGFTMNDDLLKKAGGGDYFKELLERIRDIRSSEKVFYRQILDIYATSIDYDPRAETTNMFFRTVQNKMHYAAHGHTAAEVLMERINAELPFLGMTNFSGAKPTKKEATIAKNFLQKDEIEILNRIVSSYLEFAELQALRRKTMTMNDWITKLDDFIKMTDSEVLKGSGIVSHEAAIKKAEIEFKKYREKTKDELTSVELDFIESIKEAQKKIENKK